MSAWRHRSFARAVAWLVMAAMLLPVLTACVTKPPDTIRLDGIVIDGQRLARPDEAGLVKVTRDGSAVEVRARMELRVGDRIETGPRADVVIRFPSGSELMLRGGSRGRIGSITEFIGELFVKVKGAFTVETTYVRAGARGTAYTVRTGAGGTTTVVVHEGTVQVDSLTGAWPSLTLGAGEMTVAHPRAPKTSTAPAEELRTTREWVERLEKLVPPQTGVSAGGVAAGLAVAAVAVAIASSGDKDRGDRRDRREQTPAGRPASVDVDTPPDTAPALTAPTGTTPGSTALDASGPALRCTLPMALSWRPVAGARDYLVRLERLSDNGRSWTGIALPPVQATRIDLAQALDGTYRWSVQARDARGAGPSSATLYMKCSATVLR